MTKVTVISRWGVLDMEDVELCMWKLCVSEVCLHSSVRRPTGSTDPISRRTGQWLQLRLLNMNSEETDMDDYEYYE